MSRALISGAFIALALVTVVSLAESQDAASTNGESPAPFVISTDLNLVVLHATVTDHKGAFVPGLGKEDFEVYEDGVRQSIRLFQHEDIPVTVGLVVDHSGSMQPKLPEVIAAAETFARSSNRDDQMFVVDFNEHAKSGLPAGLRFSNNAGQLGIAILEFPTEGQTALYDAVSLALDNLQSGDRPKKALMIISDGGDNASSLALGQVLKKAEESNALIYSIGIFDESDPDRNPDVLRRLARVSGGEAFFPPQLSDVTAVCGRIASDIRNQYTIGYVSTNAPQSGGYRTVKVLAHSGKNKYKVRTRSGYFASREAAAANGGGAK